MLSGRDVWVSLADIYNPEILLPLGNTEEIMRYWNIMKTRTHIEKRASFTIIHIYMIEFFPGSGANSSYRTENNNPRYRSSMENMSQQNIIRGGNVNTEDLWFILFQIGYSTKYLIISSHPD